MLTWLEPGRAFMDYGPIQATISAYRSGEPLKKEVQAACDHAAEQLKDLAACLGVAKLPPDEIKEGKFLPDILCKMLSAVRSCADPTLTPMAAVAGTFADVMADFLMEKGATKVIVNNGGDVAVRLTGREFVKVGIVSDINAKSFSHVLTIDSDSEIRGIATSGFGGRSFTKGIASAAVAFGRNCRMADAAATLIANHTYSPDPAIQQVRAETVDPDTDIAGHIVTLYIGDLKPETPKKALENGMAKVRELLAMDVITGGAVFVGGEKGVLPQSLMKQIISVK